MYITEEKGFITNGALVLREIEQKHGFERSRRTVDRRKKVEIKGSFRLCKYVTLISNVKTTL